MAHSEVQGITVLCQEALEDMHAVFSKETGELIPQNETGQGHLRGSFKRYLVSPYLHIQPKTRILGGFQTIDRVNK